MATPLARAFVRLELDRINLNNSIEGAVRSGGQAGQQEADKQAAAIKSRFVRGLQFGAGLFAANGLIDSIKSIGTFAIGAASNLEQVRIGFTTMLGSAQQANQFIGQLQQFAKVTPFNLGDLEKQSQQLLAMGFSAHDIVPDLTAVGDAVAAMAGSDEDIGRITYALGQMNQEAHINAGDLRQLTDVGIPALKILADGLGVSTAKLQDMITKGQIAGSQAIPILINGLEHGTKSVRGFAGAMDAQSHTFKGLMSNLEDSSEQALANGLQPLLKSMESGLPLAVNAAGTSLHGLTAILGGMTTIVSKEPGYILAVAGAFAGYKAIPPLIDGIGNAYLGLVAKVDSARTAITALGGSAGFAGGIAIAGAWGLAIGGAGAALTTMMHRASDAKAAVDQLTGSVDKNSAASLRGAITNLNDQLLKLQDFGKNPAGSSFGKNEAEADALKKKIKELTGDLNALHNKQNDTNISTGAQASITKDAAEKVKYLSAQFRATPQGAFIQFMKDVSKAEGDLQKSTKANNDTLGSQIDLLKGYQAQAQVTAQSIQKNILDSIRTMASEGDNINKLAANGVDPKFIQQLVKEGPEYVAAVASSSKALQVQLGQQFEQGLTQQMHTAAAAARAEAPEAAKTVADAAALAAAAQKTTLQKQFYGAVQGAVDEARQLAADGGDSATTAFGARAEAGKNAVLRHMLAALPGPVRAAAESALGIATTAGGKLPQDLAAAINQHTPKAAQAAENMRRAVQARIDLLHGKTVEVRADDQASGALNTINSDIRTLEGLNNTLKAMRFADGGFVPGNGAPRADDVLGLLSSQEHITAVPSASANRDVLTWMDKNPGKRLPGFADGGPVDTWQVLMSGYVNSLDSHLNAGGLASMLSGATGGVGVTRLTGTVLTVLKMLGLSAGLVPKVLAQIATESGGQSDIVNRTDSNWAAGHPSVGDLQVIAGTYAAYAGPFRNTGPFLYGVSINDLANIFAGVNYELHKSGPSLPDFGQGHGYDNGGGLQPGWTAAYNGTGRVENVQTADQRDELAALLREQNAILRQLAPATGQAVGAVLNGVARSSRIAARTGSR